MATVCPNVEQTWRNFLLSTMQAFTFFIDDDRYTVPIRLSVELPDGVPVRGHAQAVLNETRHYRGIEVCVAGTPLFKIDRPHEKGPSYERH